MDCEQKNKDQRIEQLEKIIEEKELYLGTILHDIKNDLVSLKIALQLLRKAMNSGMENLSKFLEHAEVSQVKMAFSIDALAKKHSGTK